MSRGQSGNLTDRVEKAFFKAVIIRLSALLTQLVGKISSANWLETAPCKHARLVKRPDLYVRPHLECSGYLEPVLGLH